MVGEELLMADFPTVQAVDHVHERGQRAKVENRSKQLKRHPRRGIRLHPMHMASPCLKHLPLLLSRLVGRVVIDVEPARRVERKVADCGVFIDERIEVAAANFSRMGEYDFGLWPTVPEHSRGHQAVHVAIGDDALDVEFGEHVARRHGERLDAYPP